MDYSFLKFQLHDKPVAENKLKRRKDTMNIQNIINLAKRYGLYALLAIALVIGAFFFFPWYLNGIDTAGEPATRQTSGTPQGTPQATLTSKQVLDAQQAESGIIVPSTPTYTSLSDVSVTPCDDCIHTLTAWDATAPNTPIPQGGSTNVDGVNFTSNLDGRFGSLTLQKGSETVTVWYFNARRQLDKGQYEVNGTVIDGGQFNTVQVSVDDVWCVISRDIVSGNYPNYGWSVKFCGGTQ